MKINSVYAFLKSLPNQESSDGKNLLVRCPFCGDSVKHSDSKHFSIKVDVDEREPMVYKCFRADYLCGAKGIVSTKTLQMLGCTDMKTLLELAQHNAKISKSIDRFNPKRARSFVLTNSDTKRNYQKAQYINKRLGVNMTPSQMKDLKIQLGLWDFIRINGIKKLAYSKSRCEQLDEYTIGFMSAYSDYLILRDITPNLETGYRYVMYRASGTPDPDDMKMYVIPGEIDIMSPRSANINVAEGTFSILGAYLHCEEGKDRPNNIFAANCGTGYAKTISHLTKQYGLLKVRIHIWSDSEVPLKTYQKLYQILKSKMDIRSFEVHYNKLAEDFGHSPDKIEVTTATIK